MATHSFFGVCDSGMRTKRARVSSIPAERTILCAGCINPAVNLSILQMWKSAHFCPTFDVWKLDNQPEFKPL